MTTTFKEIQQDFHESLTYVPDDAICCWDYAKQHGITVTEAVRKLEADGYRYLGDDLDGSCYYIKVA